MCKLNKKESVLYKKAWLSWRGKAGAWAKNKNHKLELANAQKYRYFKKWADSVGIDEDTRLILIKNKYV